MSLKSNDRIEMKIAKSTGQHSTFAETGDVVVYTKNNQKLILQSGNSAGAITIDGSNNYVGIGTKTPKFHLDVSGNLNLSGNLYQGGSLYKSSQWNDASSNKIYYSLGNVGVGTTNAQSTVHIRNTGTIGQNLTALALQNSSGGTNTSTSIDFITYTSPSQYWNPSVRIGAVDDNSWSANMVISTKTPGVETNPLVERVRVTSAGRVGIGSTVPSQVLDVSGNIHFTGSLYKSGSLYISSQWTDGSFNSLYYNTGNVGINTSAPDQRLVVRGDVKLYSDILPSTYYPYNSNSFINPPVSYSQIVSSDTSTNKAFGHGCAMSYDGYTLVAGAYADTIAGRVQQGSVYVYKWNGTTWAETKLTTSDGSGNHSFGASVATSGDGNIVVGGASGTNACYVFKYSGGSWVQTKLVPSDPSTYDYFGTSVAISYDGYTIAATSFSADVSGNVDAGALYVFKYNGSTWTQQAKLTASDASANDRLGIENVNMSYDGSTIVVGANYDDILSNTDQGSVYVFSYNGSSWIQRKLVASDGVANDNFGFSVAISADGTKIAVGSPGVSTSPYTINGAVYIFEYNNNTWTQLKRLTVSDIASTQALGWYVSMSADGKSVLAGAPYHSSYIGTVYLFKYDGNTWAENKITSRTLATERFGSSLALSGDGHRCVIGTYNGNAIFNFNFSSKLNVKGDIVSNSLVVMDGTVYAPSIAFNANTDTGIYHPSGNIGFTVNAKDVMRLDGSGNVGIGTTLPKYTLDVSGNVKATTFIGDLSGNASTVTNGVYTSRNVSTGTGLTGGGNLSADRTIALTDISAGNATAGALAYNGTTQSIGKLYGGTTNPTNTARLNYDGYLYATRFFGDVSGNAETVTNGVYTSRNVATSTGLTGGGNLSADRTISLIDISAGSATLGALAYNGTTQSIGKLYGGTTNPTNTVRLNYDGYLYATRFVGDISGNVVSGTVNVPYGGTGNTTLSANKLLVGNGTNPVLQPTNLHWDNSNNRLGIGSTTPYQSLDVSGNINFTGSLYKSGSLYISSQWTDGSFNSLYYTTGNVGIGKTTVTQALDVSGNVKATTFIGDLSGNASTVTNGVYTTGNQTISGVKTFNNNTTSTSTTTGTIVVTGGVGISENLNVGGNMTLPGNLTVNGTTSTINSTTITVDDPVITLGGDTAPLADDNKDKGIEFRYYDTAARIGFFGFDDSTGNFTFLKNATNTSEVFSGTLGNIQAGIFIGDLSGNASSVTNGVYTLGNQTIAGIKTFSSTIIGDLSGNASTVTNGVYTVGNQTIAGTKTFSSTIIGDISGNASTVTNGVYTSRNVSTGTGLTGGGNLSADRTIALTDISAGSTSIGALAYNGITQSIGKLYGGTTNPTNTARLNYDGYLYATRFVGDISGNVVSGTVNVPYGGTGNTTLSANKLLVGNGTNPVLQPTNLHWDSTNSRLGIGVTSPAYTLDVDGYIQSSLGYRVGNVEVIDSAGNLTVKNIQLQDINGNTSLYVSDTGIIGIGTDSPAYTLDVSGNVKANLFIGDISGNASTVTNGVYTVGNQTIAGTKTFSSTIIGDISGNASTVTNGVYTVGNQTIAGTKTFSSTIIGDISGNASTVTNGVYTVGNQTIAGTKTFSSTIIGDISGNASTVTNGVYTSRNVATGTGLTGGGNLSADRTISLIDISAGSTQIGGLAYNGTTQSIGKLYGGTTNPTNTTRLNYDGYLYASKFVGDVSGNAETVTNGVYTVGNQTISGVKTFNNNTTSSSTTTGTIVVTGGVGISENLNVGGNIAVTGNLTVNGSTTTVNSTTITVNDPIISLAGNTTNDTKDRGLDFKWYNGSVVKLGFMGLDQSTQRFIFLNDASHNNDAYFGTQATVEANSFMSSVNMGTAPFTVTSSTQVNNLNVDYLDGQHGSYYLDWTNATNKPNLVNTFNTRTGDVSLNSNDVTTALAYTPINPAANTTITGTFTFGGTAPRDAVNMGNCSIYNLNTLRIADPGTDEGIIWEGGNLWKIYESPDNLGNGSGNLQIVQNATRRATFTTTGQLDIPVAGGTAPFLLTSTSLVSNLNADYLDGQHGSYYTNTSNINAGTLSVNYGGIGTQTLLANKLLVGSGTNAVLSPSNLHWDNSNNRLGIGSTTPYQSLDVSGNINFTGSLYKSGSLYISSQWTDGSFNSLYYTNGNVGIGKTTVTQALDVSGNVKATLFIGDVSGNASSVTNGVYTTRTITTSTGLSGGSTLASDLTLSLTDISAGSTTTGALAYNGTTQSAGKLYGGTTVPTNSARLNYDGYLYATKFVGDVSGNVVSGIVSVSNGGIGTATLLTNKLLVGNGTNYVLSPNNLHWDGSNNRLGIGVTSPTNTLDVAGYINSSLGYKVGNVEVIDSNGNILIKNLQMQDIYGNVSLYVSDTGQIGIGTDVPLAPLDVSGNVRASTFTSIQPMGTAPMTVVSSTIVLNLNADLLDGLNSTSFMRTDTNTSTIGIVDISNNTGSTSTTSGALIVRGGVGIAQNLYIGGNLVVNGSTMTINSTTVTVDDPIITLGGDTAPVADDNKDRGVEFRYYDTSAKVGFFGFDDSTGYFTFLKDASNNSEVFTGTVGDAQFGNVLVNDGSASAPSITFSNDTNTGLYRIGNDTLGFTTAGTERVRIDATGNVGIGSTAPGYPLDVSGNARATTFISTQAMGTAPLTVTSSTVVTNLNADYLDGQHSTYYQNASNMNAGTLSVNYGGIGTQTLLSNKLLVGNGTNAILSPTNLHWDINNSRLGIGTTIVMETLHVEGNIFAKGVMRVVTIDLTSQTNTQFYPVIFERAPVMYTHYFSIEMPALSSSAVYNMHSLHGVARGGGWSDQTVKYEVYHNFYTNSERSILGIYRGTQDFADIAIYLRGGQTYTILTSSQSVYASLVPITLKTFDTSNNTSWWSTFAIKNSSGTDVSGTSVNVAQMWNGITSQAGKYYSDTINGNGSGVYSLNASNIGSGTLSVNYGGIGTQTLLANKLLVGNGTNAVLSPTNLHWNDTNTRLGIGSTTPAYNLDVSGTALISSDMTVNGNVGIGTSITTARLHVSKTDTGDIFRIDDETNETTPFIVKDTGNIGIGIAAPTTRLDVMTLTGYVGDVLRVAPVAQQDAYDMKLNIWSPQGGQVNYKFITKNVGTIYDNVLVFENNKIGINKDRPVQPLDVSGNTVVSGNVGIGTTVPTHKVHIYGSSNTNTDYESTGLLLENSTNGETGIAFKNSITGSNVWAVGLDTSSNRLDFNYGAQTAQMSSGTMMCIDASGNVGIGSLIPAFNLDISGTANISNNLTVNGKFRTKDFTFINLERNADTTTVKYFKLATVVNGANGDTGINISGIVGRVDAISSIDYYLTVRSGVKQHAIVRGNYDSRADLVLYQEADTTTYTLYAKCQEYFTVNLIIQKSGIDGANIIYTPASATDYITSPTGTLHTASILQLPTRLQVAPTTGYLGIGNVASPSHKLHIYGSSNTDTDYESAGILLENTTNGETGIAFKNSITGSNIWAVGLDTSSNRLDFNYGAQTAQMSLGTMMCIDSIGNVGIGTTTPKAALDIGGGTLFVNGNPTYQQFTANDKVLQIRSTTQSVINLVSDASANGSILGGVYYGRTQGQADAHINLAGMRGIYNSSVDGADLAFLVNYGASTYEALRINLYGNVGIGNTSPGQKLDVTGSIRASSQLISTVASGTAPLNVTSTSLITNLNADYLDGLHNTSFMRTDTNTSTTGTLSLPDGTASVPSLTFTADTNTGLYRISEDTLGVTTGGSERVRIDSAGNVGIGTNLAQYRLHVETTNANTGFIKCTTNDVVASFIASGKGDNTNAKSQILVQQDTTGGPFNLKLIQSATNTAPLASGTVNQSAAIVTDGNRNLYLGTNDTARITIAGTGDVSVANNLTIGGNLIVNGATTTVNSTTVTVDDPIITLGGDTAPTLDDNKDRGVEFRYYDTSAKIGFFGYDDSTGYFTFIRDASNNSEVFSGTTGAAQFSNVFSNVGTASSPSFTFTNDTNVGMFRPANNTLGFSTYGTEKMRIDASGNVGIGSSSPVQKLDVNGSISASNQLISTQAMGTAPLQVTSSTLVSNLNADYLDGLHNTSFMRSDANTSTTGTLSLPDGSVSAPSLTFTNDTNTGLYRIGNDILGFATGGTSRMRIDASGNVGIGTNMAITKLQVAGDVIGGAFVVEGFNGYYMGFNAYWGGSSWVKTNTNHPSFLMRGGSDIMYFHTIANGQSNLVTQMALTTDTGNLGIGTLTPFARLHVAKTDTGDIFRIDDASNDTTPFIVKDDGNVGIGTLTPTHKLHIYGTSNADTDYESAGILLENSTNGETGIAFKNTITGSNVWAVGLDSSSNRLDFNYGAQTSQMTAGNTMMCIDASGNVGIGTNNVAYKLYVNGSLYANNLTLGGSIIKNTLQIQPVRLTRWVDASANNPIVVSTPGLYQASYNNVEIHRNGVRLYYIDASFNDYTVSYTYSAGTTYFNITLSTPPVYGDLIDILVWPQLTQVDASQNGTVYQSITVNNLQWAYDTSSSNIYYNAGNVGIGTTMAVKLMEVRGATADTQLQVRSVANITGIQLSINNGTSHTQYHKGAIYLDAGSSEGFGIGDLKFAINNSATSANVSTSDTKMILTRTGRLGIGTLTPIKQLDVSGNAYITGDVGLGVLNPSYKFHVSGDIYATGNVIALSDARVKSNLVQITEPSTKVDALTGYTYNIRQDTRRHTGLIAQDVQKVLPEAVYEDADGYLAINYGSITGLLVETIKEMRKEIYLLKARVLALESMNL